MPKGYNLTDGGDGLCNPPAYIRRQKSMAMKKLHANKEYKQKLRRAISKTKRTDQNRLQSSVAMKKCWMNPEFRKKNLQARNNPEVKARAIAALRKTLQIPGVKRRMRASALLAQSRPELIQLKKKVMNSPEVVKKCREAAIRGWQNKESRRRRIAGIRRWWNNPNNKKKFSERAKVAHNTPTAIKNHRAAKLKRGSTKHALSSTKS
jgi:hypothetical protein